MSHGRAINFVLLSDKCPTRRRLRILSVPSRAVRLSGSRVPHASECDPAKALMAQVIQVEMRTATTHAVTWLDASLKPKPGMVLVCKGDPRAWSVVHAYGNGEGSKGQQYRLES